MSCGPQKQGSWEEELVCGERRRRRQKQYEQDLTRGVEMVRTKANII